jgi:hypothetical protein
LPAYGIAIVFILGGRAVRGNDWMTAVIESRRLKNVEVRKHGPPVDDHVKDSEPALS